MKNWKTTLIGLTIAIIVAIQPLVTEGELDLKQIFIAALIGAFSFFTKDNDVTGGTKTQPTVKNIPTK